MKRGLFILIGVVMLWNVAAQTMVYLEHCEALSFDQKRVPDAQLLRGNVRFRHEDVHMFCDSAYFYEKTNSVDAFGHVRFVQGDTLEGTGEILHYDGNTKLARLHNNVVLTHITTILNTDILYYDRVMGIAYYATGGTISDGQDVLTSQFGSYHVSYKTAEFKTNVHLQNEQFKLDADTLVYYTAEHVTKIVRPTTIVYEDETTILSHDGWYNTSTETSMLLSRSRIVHKDGKELTGDTIFYDRKLGKGEVFGQMEMKDTVQKATLVGNYGIMMEKEKSGFATKNSFIIDWSQPNRSYIHADTIFTEPIDSASRRVRAFFNVRAYNKDYQFVCDSMVYDGHDSIITMYHEPVLWNQDNQVSADTLFVYIIDGKVDYARGVGAALGIKQEGEEAFDQMSGQEMKAYIRDGELREIQVSGNAETVFYPRNEDSTFVGVNKSQSSYVTIYMENNKVHHVLFTTATTGTLYPVDQIPVEDTRLIGFFWATQERPTSPQDIFLRPKRTPRPTQKAISATEEDEEETKPQTRTTTKRNRKEK